MTVKQKTSQQATQALENKQDTLTEAGEQILFKGFSSTHEVQDVVEAFIKILDWELELPEIKNTHTQTES